MTNLSNPSKSVKRALDAKPALFQLPPGLYALRMLGSNQGERVNPVALSVAPGGRAEVDFLPAAGIVDNTFTKVHDCIAVRVMEEVATLVATEFHHGEPLSARLEIERIDVPKPPMAAQQQVLAASGTATVPSHQLPPTSPQQSTRKTSPKQSAQPLQTQLLGHIERTGDVVTQNDWLGDPDSDHRLEGFAIKVNGLPPNLKLVYGCKFMSPKLKSQVTNEGKFVGTRQKAQAIQSVVFGLQGKGAEHFTVTGQLVFSGRHLCDITPATQLRGPTGKEHLVAIHLQIVPDATIARNADQADQAEPMQPLEPAQAGQAHQSRQPRQVRPSARGQTQQAQAAQHHPGQHHPGQQMVEEDIAYLAEELDVVDDPEVTDRKVSGSQKRFSEDGDGAWSDDDIAEIFGR